MRLGSHPMDAVHILDLADKAARCVRRRYDLQWTPEDFEDARQEAAASICRALRDRPNMGEGYYFRAGVQGATRQAFRHASLHAGSLTRSDGSTIEDGEPIETPSRGWATPLGDAELPTLRRLLGTVRRKPDARGGPKTRDQLAVARDLVILVGLSEGLSQSQIGEQLGLPKGHVHKYQQNIRRRLAATKGEQE